MQSTETLYELDYSLWSGEQVALLRAGKFGSLDTENLIEELESWGRSDRRALDSQMVRLMLHLLKWQYQPRRRSPSWESSIFNARSEIEVILEDSPSLRNYLEGNLQKNYMRARKEAVLETRLPFKTFPEKLPYTLPKLLEDWLPG